MKAAAVFSILALAGSTLAAPAPLEKKDVKIVYETVVHTVMYTPGAQPTGRPRRTRSRHHFVPSATPTPSAAPAPAPSSVVEEVQPSSSAVVVAPSPTSAAAQPASTGGSSSGPSYMSVVDEWRQKLGLSALTYSTMLEGNALDTVKESNGVMTHKLNPGTFGQVLAPGQADGFEKVFVGGWLCEKPDMAGLDGICDTMSQGWAYNGQTGHAEILTSPDYSHIGCALYAGIWACDLGNE